MHTTVRPITTTEVAELLGIARSTVRQRVDNGKLVPIGQLPGRNGAYLFDAEQIEALAAERTAEAQR
jgi:excisionase family DNA binding protein